MRYVRKAAWLTLVALLYGIAPTQADANGSGGTQVPAIAPAGVSHGAQAPSVLLTGGSEYGASTKVLVGARPVVAELSVPRAAPAGRPPRVALQIDEAGMGTVEARLTVTDLATHTAVITLDLGWVHTGRLFTVAWPRSTTLKPGSYQVSLAAHDQRGWSLLRSSHSPGQANLTIRARAKSPAMGLVPSPVRSASSPEAGVPTPAQSAAAGAVFPVAGAHSFGGPENRFGAPRDGYTHEGQDVLTAEGTPVVAPLAGTILTTSYQAGGAGYYAVEHSGVWFDFMFAHCEAGSLAVSTGEVVSAGQALCAAGQTGDATAPHLYFEIWVGGWQAPGAHPIDPLPYLEAWEHSGAGG
jgi:murein DD-endopeptidase MepM/ murein hydrolase activator NlpD